VPIERNVEEHSHKTSFTIGLIFLNDLLYLFGIPNFWECLNEPVIDFLKEIYGGQEGSDQFSDYRSEAHQCPILFNQDKLKTAVKQQEEEAKLQHHRK
jgi:hypothetical protein